MKTPRYLTSVTQSRTCPVILQTLAHAVSQRGPILMQQNFLKLIAMSNQINSSSHLWSNNSSPTTDGEINRMSSAYSITKQLCSGEHNLTKSSRYRANKYGARTEPCLIPKLTLKDIDRASNHLTQVKQSEHNTSITLNNSTDIFLFISLINRACRLTLSNALDRSIAHKLNVLA